MKKDIEKYYEKVDEKLEKIEKKLKRINPEEKLDPVILNYDEVPFWYYKKPQSSYDFKGTKRVPIANMGGGKNEKARFTVILAATSEGKMYPPVVIMPGGKYPGIKWKPSNIEVEKDLAAAELLKKSRKLGEVLVLYNDSGNINIGLFGKHVLPFWFEN